MERLKLIASVPNISPQIRGRLLIAKNPRELSLVLAAINCPRGAVYEDDSEEEAPGHKVSFYYCFFYLIL
jgi:hypothetical protein